MQRAIGGHEGVLVQLKPGQRLRSQVCTTEVIIVRAPKTEMQLACGGQPMVDIAESVAADAAPEPGLDTGTVLGKRYTAPDDESVEVLVTVEGAGTLTTGSTPLVARATKPLPSSD
jgi:hypothetical protein